MGMLGIGWGGGEGGRRDKHVSESVSLEKRRILGRWKGKRKLLNESHGKRRGDEYRDYNLNSGSILQQGSEKNEESGNFGGNDDGTSKDKNNVSRRTYSDYETKLVRNQDSTDIYGYDMVVDNLKFYKPHPNSPPQTPPTTSDPTHPQPPYPPKTPPPPPNPTTKPQPTPNPPHPLHPPPIAPKRPKSKPSSKNSRTTRPKSTIYQNPPKNPFPSLNPGSLSTLTPSTPKNSYMETRENIVSSLLGRGASGLRSTRSVREGSKNGAKSVYLLGKDGESVSK
jgi:hypothetical protein